MFKPQMKFQKILYIVLLIMAASVFIYAVGLCTDVYPLYISMAYGSVEGADFYDDIQIYNSELLKFSIVIILASVLPFIFSSNTRRKYYLDNLISNIITGVLYIACSIFLLINTITYKNLYLEKVDVDAYIDFCQRKKLFFSGTTIWFDLGYVFAALLLVGCIAMVINYIWKVKLMKKEEEYIAKGVNG